MSRMIDQKKWPISEHVIHRDIINIFGSHSSYYDNAKVFENVHWYPEMQDWLSGKEGGPSTSQVWGNRSQTMADLEDILNAHHPNQQKSKKPKEASSSKKSKEKTPSSSSTSEDIAAVDSPIPKHKKKGKQVDGRKKDEKKDKKRKEKDRDDEITFSEYFQQCVSWFLAVTIFATRCKNMGNRSLESIQLLLQDGLKRWAEL
ncbi:hypothetical protein BD410DRAFT_810671 [Rickenella mellea]|uniref:Uncharacterized protein n=1 Tax=Rickenella mellea TaxID=50990 RepID=A0A4Y7PFN9_9AGAM|nr:hypothetical protein BD410DRAFT_810671 [Rickenella mellea]